MAEAAAPVVRARKVICRYYMHGACRHGESCQFSHDLKQGRPSSVCKYYQKGSCTYGDRCRYDHTAPGRKCKESREENGRRHLKTPLISPERSRTTLLSPERSRTTLLSPERSRTTLLSPEHKSNLVTLKKGQHCLESKPNGVKKWREDWVKAAEFVPGQTWKGSGPTSYSNAALSGLEQNGESIIIRDDNQELCPYAAHGTCQFGDTCEYVHGDLCDICGRAALKPGDEEQNVEHRKACIKVIEDDMERSFAIAQSKDKTCGICMETVLEKNPPAERKFGILSNCNHTFCLSCIRTWRQAKQFENKIVRACPECRVKSDFVTPSNFWVEDKEEKQKLIEGYKTVLSKKPCKYFDQGRGECPFNEHCFYRHAYPDGRIASPKPRVRRQRRNQDGELGIFDQLLLWDFLEESDHQRSVLENVEDLFFHLSLLEILDDTDDSESDNDVEYFDSDLFDL